MSSPVMRFTVIAFGISVFAAALQTQSTALQAQSVVQPDLGYVYPPEGRAGETIDVKLGVYDFTPDLQFFVLDHAEHVRLEITGPPGPLLLHGAPFLSGTKAYSPLPLPREIPARLHLSADLPAGRIRWQIANANGSSKIGSFFVTRGRSVLEKHRRGAPQRLDGLPITVSGRLVNNEEVDRYSLQVDKPGPITLDLFARRIGSQMHGVLEVRDDAGGLIDDVADTAGRDAQLTFRAETDRTYTVSVRDLDFRGHRSYVYRLGIRTGPRVAAAIPAAGQPGETREVELIGVGIASGQAKRESVKRSIVFPADRQRDSWDYLVATPFGEAGRIPLLLSDLPQIVRSANGSNPQQVAAPIGVTGVFDENTTKHRYRWDAKKGRRWTVKVTARRLGSPVDAAVFVNGPDGKQIGTNDDLPGTIDAGLAFTAPADGAYEVVVKNLAGRDNSMPAVYHIAIAPAVKDFKLRLSQQRINVPIGGKAELELNVERLGGFNEPIAVAINGLPSGVSLPDLVVPKDAAKIKIPFQSAADASSFASLISISGTAKVNGENVTRTAMAPDGSNLVPRSPLENEVAAVLLVSTIKPVCKVWPEESDERTVHRGSTHLGGVLFERLNGFDGKLLVCMTAKQDTKFRQGLGGPDAILPAGANHFNYPCFLPEGLETIDAYRMALNAVAEVNDPQGNRRFLVTRFRPTVSFGITIEGALLRLSHQIREMTVRSGESFEIPVRISRSPKLQGPVRLELKTAPELAGLLNADPIVVPPGRNEAVVLVSSVIDSRLPGEQTLTIRATALQPPAVELPKLVDAGFSPLDRDLIDHLKNGRLPVMSEIKLPIRFAADRGKAE